MIMAAINPETKEFLGLIIPKEDLDISITIKGSAEDWAAALRGETVFPGKLRVEKWMATVSPNMTVSVGRTSDMQPHEVEMVPIFEIKAKVEDL